MHFEINFKTIISRFNDPTFEATYPTNTADCRFYCWPSLVRLNSNRSLGFSISFFSQPKCLWISCWRFPQFFSAVRKWWYWVSVVTIISLGNKSGHKLKSWGILNSTGERKLISRSRSKAVLAFINNIHWSWRATIGNRRSSLHPIIGWGPGAEFKIASTPGGIIKVRFLEINSARKLSSL